MSYTYERTAADRLDVHAALMSVHRKAMTIEQAGVAAVLAKIGKAAKAFKYELDMSRSYIGFRTGRSDPDSAEGELFFKPLPTRQTWASTDEFKSWCEQTLDLWGARDKGDGQFIVYIGG